MGLRIRWSTEAVNDLRDIKRYIGLDSPVQSRRMVLRLIASVKPLADFPRMGHIVRGFERDAYREWAEPPYRIVYRIDPDQITIGAVLHGARDAARFLRSRPIR